MGLEDLESAAAEQGRDSLKYPEHNVLEVHQDLRKLLEAITPRGIPNAAAPDGNAASREDVPSAEDSELSGVIDAGYTRMFASELLKATPSGTPDTPSMLLEIGGGQRPRPYNPTDITRKNIAIGNMDISPQWGDRQFQCDLNRLSDGLHSDDLKQMLAGTSLGSVVMSHTVSFLETQSFEKILESAVERLSKGGHFTLLETNVSPQSAAAAKTMLRKMGKEENSNDDWNVHDLLYARALKAIAAMGKLVANEPEHLRFQRYALGPAFQISTAQKLRNADSDKARDLASRMLREGKVKLIKLPVNDASAFDEHFIGNKVMLPELSETVLEIEKIDPEKDDQQKRTRNLNKRAEEQKKKRARKQQKKNRR